MAYIFGSIWDRFNRNALNELSKSVEYQGKSIQDLVAEGQLTPSQYAELIQAVNGLISKGDVSVYDINKNLGKLDGTYFSSDFLRELQNGEINTTELLPNSVLLKHIEPPVVIGEMGKNLYNKSTSELNKTISASSGDMVNNAGTFASDFISVLPSTTYAIKSSPNGVAVYFFDDNRNLLNYITNPETFKTPVNCYELRIRANNDFIDKTQLEIGSQITPYEPYGAFVDTEFIRDETITEEKLKGEIPLRKIEGFRLGRNLFNKKTVTPGMYILSGGGLRYSDDRSLSDYIQVKPSTQYTLSTMQHMAMFDEYKNYVSGHMSADPETFTTPANVYYMRIGMLNTELDSFQLEEGSTSTNYEPFGYVLEDLLQSSSSKPEPFLRLRNAVEAWYAGEKFPVAFFGDSQTDGNSTTGFRGHTNVDTLDGDGTPGSVDYIAPNAYPKKLEEFIQKETDNPTARIYNAGYSGHSLNLMLGKREQLFSQAYADTKMVGISMGTNDRNLEVDRTRLEKRFKRDLIEYVEWFYSKNIQPFILTSQASVEPDTMYESQQLNQVRNKKSEITHAVINRIKKEVAKEYDLEVIDVSSFGELFLTYSNISAAEIILDKLHFKDPGHLAQGGYIFSKMFDRVVEVEGNEILSFTNQTMRSKVAFEHTTMLENIDDGFKVIVDYTKDNTDDMLILDFWVLIKGKSTFTLKSFVKNTNETYVVLNGENIKINEQEQTLSNELDIGLHSFQVFTGNSSVVDFKGFKLIQNNY